MARAPLVLETHGKILRKKVNGVPTAYTRYRDADGVTRKVQRIGKTLADAQQNLEKALKLRNFTADEHAELTLDSTVDDLVQEWLTEAREAGTYATATLRTYAKRAETVITPGIGMVRLREVGVSKIDRFVKLVTKSRGPGTARTVRSVLINAFDLARRHGLVDINYARNTAPVPATRTTPEAPDLDMVKRFIDHLRAFDEKQSKSGRTAYLHDLVTMFISTGARTAEILALKWPEVHLEETPARVSIAATLVVNESGKLERQGYTKTQSGMRRLQLPASATAMLSRRRVDAYNEIVFPSANGNFRWPHNLRRDWREAVVGSEFEGITPKSFRKAVATLLRDEMGIEVARDQLGHSDERVTKSHYAQRLSEAPDASKVLERFFQSAE